MVDKDLYDALIQTFEIQLGKVPNREKLLWAFRETLSEDDLRIFFLFPATGPLSLEKIITKAARRGIPREEVERAAGVLHREGFLLSYDRSGERVYERAFISFTIEQQVRRRQNTPVGRVYGDFWIDLGTISVKILPSKTPYFRAVPVEETIKPSTGEKIRIPVNQPVADNRAVLPIDIISEMVKREPLIAVSECYCRLSKRMQDQICEHADRNPKETCFTFNELAQTLIETNLARRVSADEAVEILYAAEKAGLIHNIDNCQGKLKALCNCCACCCPAVKAFKDGYRNVNGASRYMAVYSSENCTHCYTCLEVCPVGAISNGNLEPVFDAERCIGCGHCVSNCPSGSIHMTLREKLPFIPATNDALWARIRREAIVGFIWNKIRGK